MGEQRDAGVGLVEVVIALLILGVVISALAAAVITGVRSSTAQRQLTTTDIVMRSYAEAVKTAVRTSCGSGTWTASYPGTLPAGYSVSGGTGNCPTVSGFTAVTITVTGPAGAKTLSMAVRRP